MWKCCWLWNYTTNQKKIKMNLHSILSSQETEVWNFRTSSTSNCLYMFLLAISENMSMIPFNVVYIDYTWTSYNIYCIQSWTYMYNFKREVWLFVSWCCHCSCGSRRFNCILLVFFRSLIMCYLLCSAVIGCMCSCIVTEFSKVPYLPVYDAHFFSIKISIKIAVRIIHGFNCLSSTS